LLTSSDAAQDELTALESGADSFVQKGGDLAALVARVGSMILAMGRSARAAWPSAASILLAIDDTSTYLDRLAAELDADGYNVLRAASREGALRTLEERHVDAVLLDLADRGLATRETCRRIKADQRLRHIPVLISTPRGDKGAMIDGINA